MVELLGSSAEDHAEEIAEIVEFEALVANYSETQVGIFFIYLKNIQEATSFLIAERHNRSVRAPPPRRRHGDPPRGVGVDGLGGIFQPG